MPKIRGDSIGEHRVRMREDLVTAAARQFYRQGFEKSSFEAIADEIGIGRTTLYEYFRSKEDLLAAVIEDQAPKHIDRILANLPTQGSALVWLERFFVEALEMVAAHAELAALLFRDAVRLANRLDVMVAARINEVDRQILDVCERGVRAGELAPLESEVLGSTVIDAVRTAIGGVAVADDPKREASRRIEVWWPLLRGSLSPPTPGW